MFEHIKITIFDWMCNENRLLMEIENIYKDYDIGVFVNNNTDGKRNGIDYKANSEYDITQLIEDLRIRYDIMLAGTKEEMIIRVDTKGKRFSQR
jgi:hypothetical protein